MLSEEARTATPVVKMFDETSKTPKFNQNPQQLQNQEPPGSTASSPSTSSTALTSPTSSSPEPEHKINASIPLKKHVVDSHETNCTDHIDKGGHIEKICVHIWHKGNDTMPDDQTPRSNTSTPAPTGGHPIPMGDCRCGRKPAMERVGDARELNRPWMVHFRIRLASMR